MLEFVRPLRNPMTASKRPGQRLPDHSVPVCTGNESLSADFVWTDADIVIGTEADFGDHNYIKNGILGGFDIELTKAVCKHAGKTCAIVTVPWESVWPRFYPEFGWPDNTKGYPGLGINNAWFDCTCGTRNTILRQQSTAFTDPYTDKTLEDAGFVTRKEAPIGPAAAGKKVGLLAANPATTFFRAHLGAAEQFNPSKLVEKNHPRDLWELLEEGKVDAVYISSAEADAFLGTRSRNADELEKLHFGSIGRGGVSYMCRSQVGGMMEELNHGLREFMKTVEYRLLCDQYPQIHCAASTPPIHKALYDSCLHSKVTVMYSQLRFDTEMPVC